MIDHSIPEVEEIQDLVEDVLLASSHKKTAKAYILCRELHALIRKMTRQADVKIIDQYLGHLDWKIEENSNLTMDLQPPAILADQPAIIGGRAQKETYGQFQREMTMINRAFLEVMTEGDAQGCNFRCPFCHNRQIWPHACKDGHQVLEEDVLALLDERRGFLSGLVITGGEPTLQTGLVPFIREVKRMGMAVKLDTNGSRPDVLKALLTYALVDYIAMDVKAPWVKYDHLCGCAVNVDDIHGSIDIISENTVPHLFRTTFCKALLSVSDLEAIRNSLPPHSNICIQPFRDVQ